MQALRVVMLLVTVVVCYLLFFHAQPPAESRGTGTQNADLVALGSPGTSPATARTQYKEAMDRAHAAARAMQDERKEADSY